ncbi:MAG: hypothetical protein JWO06_3880 [Bacteroidota bacterium]|nr:hypothetical protein [Bacteroidota bacterium]
MREWYGFCFYNRKLAVMSNEEQKRGCPDWTRINLSEEYEAAYWVKKFGVSREVLDKAVKKAGPIVADIEAFLAGSR